MLKKLKTGLKHAFAVEPPGYQFTEEETLVVDKVARFVATRGLAAPAILFAKSAAPMNMLGSQLLVFFRPFANMVFNDAEFRKFAEILEHRNSVEFLVARIEEAERKRLEKKKKSGETATEKKVGQGT